MNKLVALCVCLSLGCEPPDPHDTPRPLKPWEMNEAPPKPVRPRVQAVVPEPPAVPPRVTLEEYHRIKKGMSYAKVVEIVGDPGEQSMHHLADWGDGEPMETVGYKWMNDDYSVMSLMFENDELIMKSQYRLK